MRERKRREEEKKRRREREERKKEEPLPQVDQVLEDHQQETNVLLQILPF